MKGESTHADSTDRQLRERKRLTELNEAQKLPQISGANYIDLSPRAGAAAVLQAAA